MSNDKSGRISEDLRQYLSSVDEVTSGADLKKVHLVTSSMAGLELLISLQSRGFLEKTRNGWRLKDEYRTS